MTKMIKIIGARQNNLKNITLEIPTNEFVVITGVSGSGKSSLAFDTIFSEAQREFLDSMSSYARRSIPRISKADVDTIEGLTPSVVIDQHPLGRNPRSTVGTVTEIYTYLRLLYSRLGKPILSASDFSFNRPSGACETCKGLGFEIVPDMNRLFDFNKSLNQGAIKHKTWKVNGRYWNIIVATGFFDMDKKLADFSEEESNKLFHSEPIKATNDQPGYVQSFSFEGVISRLLKRQNDSRGLTGNSYDEQFFTKRACLTCKGARINSRAREVQVNGRSIVDLVNMEIHELHEYLKNLKGSVADAIIPYINKLLSHMIDSGIGYLTVNRSIGTLSNGEVQRLKLARQLGVSLTGLIYVLDEPTRGLHPRDTEKLLGILDQLKNKGNSLLVVEHDMAVMQHADHIIDIGPGAGKNGGKIVGQGSPGEIRELDTLTGEYMSKRKKVTRRLQCLKNAKDFLTIEGAKLHNLKNINVKIPRNALTCLTGVSGSGKSSLIEVFLKKYSNATVVDQSAVGANARSIPATYTKAFDDIRKEFSREVGIEPSLLTFNGAGACHECDGLGYKVIDMHFLGDVQELCPECQGKRYVSHVLDYRYKNKTISDVLEMTISEALTFFSNKSIIRALSILESVGLGYLTLGQPLNTLSGGEAQRVKLASRLRKKGEIYVLDEPTSGLHIADIDLLLEVINKLVKKNNTVIVVEHNLEIISNADWVIDLGPEGGDAGGYIVAEGTPEEIAKTEASYTGNFLSELFLGNEL
ncbi:putative UvrABC system protein A [Maridesulfovibrio hydrothermalis AM13 = DSM 14728]|uniref:UvrABC system protein A n=2 Tax=Maridesulfovibrio TaxID=2794998 RepID=L0R7U8_9BACT|nr:putative UvrABC system protein A [Maridesulfovibrio hydrothermalis AM13 = DSM 14728]